MKLVIILAWGLFSSLPSLACSELGPMEWDVSEEVKKTCGKLANEYASEFGRSMIKIEKRAKNYDGPQGAFKLDHPLPAIYTARSGSPSKVVGFNVGLNFKNKWECNFCVEMSLMGNGKCRVDSIRNHMCAK